MIIWSAADQKRKNPRFRMVPGLGFLFSPEMFVEVLAFKHRAYFRSMPFFVDRPENLKSEDDINALPDSVVFSDPIKNVDAVFKRVAGVHSIGVKIFRRKIEQAGAEQIPILARRRERDRERNDCRRRARLHFFYDGRAVLGDRRFLFSRR